ncbi:kinesin-like protein KIN-5C isoform X2 [Elaeis guineensis]|uniref:Kinesin-like protein KIN-5C isoform X2 n=1 Tax=Elaeis guineensis var. tenera TaxID=51953 RepID=A0A6I9SID1_ELAGV|nr:kinesin-like protein KIN-5C isoform X2 [Elaeis guineensis]
MGSRHEKDKAVNVQVLLRCRPFNDDELRNNAPQVVTCNDYQREVAVTQTIAGKQIDRVFTFDKVFGPSAKQKDLYDQAVVPIVNEVLEGFNCTIFAYGQTGTGKTYTMEGECKKAKSGPKGQLPAGAGVIPRAVKQIFDTLESQNAEYSVKVTFLELYNEEITDLLAPEELSKISVEDRQKKPLPLMEDGKGGVLVRGLEEEIVTSAGEIFSLLERGSAKRRTAETLLNKQSSRSHSLFSITIHIKEATPEGEELIKCGKLNLVDLAGSENISRSGAREGRAREAGEINKSLLTLGRVITALVEHLGHVPYRDSKLTRLLRDSLGGRTKTCIIATVSPSVHCLEETLSTLDYAHRAKNIKNRPEINQKMMKSTLIKDLYGEIERLKAEVYAAREKVGVYIPKERYHQEESERKAMAEQIEQMGVLLENNQKQIGDLQESYNAQLQQFADLSKKLDATEKSLEHTSKLLAAAKEDLKQARYTLKEKDFVISEQRKAENALAHQACVLQSNLEKSIRDNASLFSKIAREDKLNAANRSIVNNFQADLAAKIGTLCHTVVASLDRQNEHLQSVEKLCQSSLDFHDKAVSELKRKVSASRALYTSHIEAVQNVVRLHKASSNAGLEEMSSMISASTCSLDQLLAFGQGEADQIFGDLQRILSIHRGEIANFTRELREKFQVSLDRTKGMSEFILGLLENIGKATKEFQNDSTLVHEARAKSIADFRKAYEEQSRSEEVKLLADITNLVSSHMHRQKELVEVRLTGLGDAAQDSKAIMDNHASSMDAVTTDAKRKWEEFSKQTEQDSKDGSNFSAAKHCRMEILLQQCVNSVDAASQQWKKTHASVTEMSSKHCAEVEALVRSAIESNEQHDAEVASARIAAEEDVAKDSKDVLQHFDSVMDHERNSAAGVMAAVEAHSATLHKLQVEQASQATELNRHAEDTFQNTYVDYEPTGETPIRSEPDIPSKGTIESLRAMPMEALLEEFRENHPYESKETKPSLIPRSPLVQLN